MPEDELPEDEAWIGLDPREPMAALSRQALMRAEADEMIAVYKYPTDTRDEGQMARLRGDLGDDIAMPPVNSGVYYLFHMAGPDGSRSRVTLGEGEVVPSMFVLALHTRGAEYAKNYEYRRGLLS